MTPFTVVGMTTAERTAGPVPANMLVVDTDTGGLYVADGTNKGGKLALPDYIAVKGVRLKAGESKLILGNGMWGVDSIGNFLVNRLQCSQVTTWPPPATTGPVNAGLLHGVIQGLPTAPADDQWFAPGSGQLYVDQYGVPYLKTCDAAGVISTKKLGATTQ